MAGRYFINLVVFVSELIDSEVWEARKLRKDKSELDAKYNQILKKYSRAQKCRLRQEALIKQLQTEIEVLKKIDNESTTSYDGDNEGDNES